MKVYLLSIALMSLAVDAQAEEFHVYFGNLHSHTSYSDGTATPEVAYEHARDVAGLDFLAITEHNHKNAPSRIATDHELYSGTVSISVVSTVNRFNVDGEFVAIYGQEFSSIGSGNHANVFEVQEVIDTADVPNGRWDRLLNTWLPAHMDSEGKPALMLLNHPSINKSPNSKEYGIDDFDDLATWITTLDGHAELINMVNGPSHGGSKPGSPSESEFRRYLNMGFHLAPTADQDNHEANWGDAADTRTAVIADELTKAKILAALRARHVYATEDKNLHVIGKVNGQLMGSRIQGADVPSPGSELTVELEVSDPDEPLAFYTVDVYDDTVGGDAEADVIREFEFEGDGTFTLDGIAYQEGNEYIFVKISQTNDDAVEIDRAWLAPVWFEPEASPPMPTEELALEVNLSTEVATITNLGADDIDFSGWKLVSVKGMQEFPFQEGFILQHGASVLVTSGANATENPPAALRWTNSFIWNNSGDPAELLDQDGNLRASTGE